MKMTTRQITQSNMYKFDEKQHMHSLDGKPLHGVTTVLSVIAKPALIQWAANMACDLVGTAERDRLGNYVVTRELLDAARTAHRTKKEKAGNWGSELHSILESLIKIAIKQSNGKLAMHVDFKEGVDEMLKKQVGNFMEWAHKNNVEFVESEKHVYSEELWIGGICDMVFKIDGKKYIGDIKTSSAIYNEHFFQMAAYALCLEEQGEQGIEGYLVINLKKDGTMDLKMAVDMELNKRAFKSALELYKIINALNYKKIK